jgi:hypothetical protein
MMRGAVASRPPAGADGVGRAPFLLGILATLAIGAAWLAGWMAPDAIRSEPPRLAPPRTVWVGPAQVKLNGAWERVRSGAPVIPGTDPAQTRAFAPYPGLAAFAVLTTGRAGDASLVPEGIRAALPRAPGEPRATRVGGHAAWVYRSLPAGGRGLVMDLYVLPSSAGTIAVACVASRLSRSAIFDCGQKVEGVTVPGGDVLPVGADVAFLQHLPTVLPQFDRSRVRGRAALKRAKTRAGQAAAARSLARTHRTAAASLARFGAKGHPSGRAVQAIARARDAYAALAGAAANDRPGRYRAARLSVRRADAALRRALAALSTPAS